MSLNTTTVRIPKQLGDHLARLARRTGRTRSYYAQKAIEMALEDLEDLADAADVLKNPGKRWTLEEVEAALGLED